MFVKTIISNKIFDNNSAYIYIWFSKQYKVVYVGMTNNRVGTLGRATQHLDVNGTFRKRFEEYHGCSINLSDDLTMFSFLLPQDKKFTTVEKSYREAIEYLVQKDLTTKKAQLKYSFEIVSWVRESPRISNKVVQDIAIQIVQEFSNALNSL